MSSDEATAIKGLSPVPMGKMGDKPSFYVEVLPPHEKLIPFLVSDRWFKRRCVLYLGKDLCAIGDQFRINRINTDSIRIQWISGKRTAEYDTVKTVKETPFHTTDKKLIMRVEGVINAYALLGDQRIPLVEGTWEMVPS